MSEKSPEHIAAADEILRNGGVKTAALQGRKMKELAIGVTLFFEKNTHATKIFKKIEKSTCTVAKFCV